MSSELNHPGCGILRSLILHFGLMIWNLFVQVWISSGAIWAWADTQPSVTSKDREKEKNRDLIVLAIPGVRADNMRRVRDTKGFCYLLLPIWTGKHKTAPTRHLLIAWYLQRSLKRWREVRATRLIVKNQSHFCSLILFKWWPFYNALLFGCVVLALTFR